MRKFWEKLEKNQDKMEIIYTKILYLKGKRSKLFFPLFVWYLGVKLSLLKKRRGGGEEYNFFDKGKIYIPGTRSTRKLNPLKTRKDIEEDNWVDDVDSEGYSRDV